MTFRFLLRGARRADRFNRHARWVGGSLMLASCAWPLVSQAARPMVTDDADVIDRGTCQVESWYERSRADGGSGAYTVSPSCNFFGNTEIGLGGIAKRDDDQRAFHGTSTWTIKTVLRKFDAERIGFGVALSDERSKRVHRYTLGDTSLKGIMSVPLAGDTVVAHFNLGGVRKMEEGRRVSRTIWASALDIGVAPRTRVSAELYGEQRDGTRFMLGARYALIPDRLQIDVSAGSRLGKWQSERLVTVGFVFTAPSLLP